MTLNLGYKVNLSKLLERIVGVFFTRGQGGGVAPTDLVHNDNSGRAPEELERILGVQFRDPELLIQGLTHSSFANEQPEVAEASNERLEFLGDAFLGYVVGQELFQRYPSMSEGDLTTARASLVSRQNLYLVAERLGLGKFLLVGQGEKYSGGQRTASSLAALVESLLGAVLEDQGPQQAKAVALKILQPDFERLASQGIVVDAKSQLNMIVQRTIGFPPVYRLVGEYDIEHANRKQFSVEVLVGSKVMGRGVGTKKLDAEQAAASQAIESFSNS